MPADTQSVRSLFLPGPAGRLEAVLNSGSSNATHAALVCHPHPLFGGTLHNKVVYHTMKALNGFGFPVLRFNFRGTSLSEGQHDQGRGERDDVRAALDWLEAEFHLPIVWAGFSFGAAAGLPAACSYPRVVALISVGTPVKVEDREYGYGFLRPCTLPRLFVSGDRDPFGPRPQLEALVNSLPEPRQLTFIHDADHFFEPGHLPELRQTIEQWLSQTLSLRPVANP